MSDQRRFEAQHKDPRDIQDEDIKEMIEFYQASGFGLDIADLTITMLQELLKLRKKVRADATA